MAVKAGAKSAKSSFETSSLRAALQDAFKIPIGAAGKKVGSYRWGVYAFFDYDGEPIYVGQTYEGLSSRIGRHLTNQRTDAVAMSVLDPFEVYKIRMYPLPQFDHIRKNISVAGSKRKNTEFDPAKEQLNRLELAVFNACIAASKFGAILNEKDPSEVAPGAPIPEYVEAVIVADEINKIRSHADVRIARRAQTISRLAQVISERQVSAGLRRSLLTQAKRLQHLAEVQFTKHGGQIAVPRKQAGERENEKEDFDS